MGNNLFYGKKERVNRVYNSLQNFVGDNNVFKGGEVLYVSTKNNESFDLVIIADGVHSFNELYNGKKVEEYNAIINPSDVQYMGGKDVKLVSDAAVNAFSSATPYFKNILVRDAEVSQAVTMKATESITLDGITIAGGKDASNGKIIYAASELLLKNITANENATLYNAFEGYQSVNDENYRGLKRLVAENLNIDCPSLTHNIVNVYTPADGAEIIIRNSKFNVTVDHTNILRLANYLNSRNVKVVFENVDWTYENSLSATAWDYAGLVLYQPAASDAALNGDMSNLATWTFKFRNCRYNGEKIADNGFGTHAQAFYLYDINKSGAVANPATVEGMSVVFE